MYSKGEHVLLSMGSFKASIIEVAGKVRAVSRFSVAVIPAKFNSQKMFVIFRASISRHNWSEESVRFGNLRIVSLHFGEDVVLLALLDRNLLELFTAECEAAVRRVMFFFTRKKGECSLRVSKGA